MRVVNQSWINYCDHLFRFGYFYSILTCSLSTLLPAGCPSMICLGRSKCDCHSGMTLARAFSSQLLQLHCLEICLWNNRNTRFWHEIHRVDFCSGQVVAYWIIRMKFPAVKFSFTLSYMSSRHILHYSTLITNPSGIVMEIINV